jgi:parvulin-like peptidyl-prolyl cis-trans isomerase-like protein
MADFTLKRFLREPLLHFLVIGLLLFFLYGFKQGRLNEAPNSITVSAEIVEQLSGRFKLSKNRLPTAKERTALIDNYIRDEVYYREALALGFDQNDIEVRKRLRMKLEYYLEELTADTPSDETLNTYLKNNADKFTVQAQFSFQQLYINPEKHQDPQIVVQTLLARLINGEDPSALGDSSLLQRYVPLSQARIIDSRFGIGFSEQLSEVNLNEWLGPITSTYGLHLVRMVERISPHLPALSEIRKEVEREYMVQRRAEQKEQAYQAILDGYQVTIEEPVSDTVISK